MKIPPSIAAIAAALFLAPPASAPAQETLPPEVNALKAKYDEITRRDVFQPFEKDLALAVAKYASTLGRDLEVARRNGKLQEAASMEAEQNLLKNNQHPPPVDEPDTPSGLAKLRTAWRDDLARLVQARDRKWQPAREEYARGLDALTAALVRTNKLDDALIVTRLSERMKDPALKLTGVWNIERCGEVKNEWKFNKEMTYNYGNNTGKFIYKNGVYSLNHTWDWEITLVDDDHFEGYCTRGKKGCIIKAVRVK